MAGFKERSTTSNIYDNRHAYGLFIRSHEASVKSDITDHAVEKSKHAERHMKNSLDHLFGRKRGNNESNMD